MKRRATSTRFGHFCLLVVLCCLLVQANVLANPKSELVVQGNNAFSFDLYRLFDENTNLFYSPYSISTALAMTYAGAREQTETQMATALHFTLGQDELHPAFKALIDSFNKPSKAYDLAVANSLWGQTGFKFSNDFLELTKEYYETTFKEVDFQQDFNREQARLMINEWVSEKTKKKIPELLQQDDLSALTKLVLTNAIYFKGTWISQFDPEATQESPFFVAEDETIDIPMMEITDWFKYAETDVAQVLELPYAGDDISMVVFLPQKDLASFEEEWSLESFTKMIGKLTPTKVEVYLPKFRMKERFLLNDYLSTLGMVNAFDSQVANFSGLTGYPNDLYISKVIHEAFVDVNEEGTEAAAATAVIINGKSLSVDMPPIFRANRPFVFVIRDKQTGTILFVGRLVRPSLS